MIRLMYVSTAAHPFGDQDVRSLLDEAQARNAERSITGLLVFNGYNFLQVLEGEEADILALMQSIKADRRHTGVIVLKTETIEQRSLADWSMMLAAAHRAGDHPEKLLRANGVEPEIIKTLPDDLRGIVNGFNSLS